IEVARQPGPGDDRPQGLRGVGGNAVDSQVDKLLHPGQVVDGPDVELEPGVVDHVDGGGVDGGPVAPVEKIDPRLEHIVEQGGGDVAAAKPAQFDTGMELADGGEEVEIESNDHRLVDHSQRREFVDVLRRGPRLALHQGSHAVGANDIYRFGHGGDLL